MKLSAIAQAGLLFLDPETAHETSLRALERGVYPRAGREAGPRLAQTICGMTFPNPMGIAAGYDKDARVYNPLLAMGFGFVEVGTVTPLPQPGNPRPRVFRLMKDRGAINRLGFNGGGHAAAFARLNGNPAHGILGVNIGANKNTADITSDYLAGIAAFGDVASYFTVNISSPNTPGLRDLQAPDRLNALLSAVMAACDALPKRMPVFVKLAPDIHDDDIAPTMQCLLANGVDGAVLTNTTLARDGVSANAHRGQAGGLSGAPLFRRSTRFLARAYLATEGKLALIGVGGIDSAASAVAKIKAGASLVQVYTGLIYEGLRLLPDSLGAITAEIDQTGGTLQQLIGSDVERWAAVKL